MTTEDEFLSDLAAALTPEGRTPPPDRISSLRSAAARRASGPVEPTPPSPRSPRSAGRSRRFLAAVAVAASAAAGFAVGTVVVNDDASDDLLAHGIVEFEATLVDPDGAPGATATGIRTGIGRTVQLRTGELPILPTGELYELWFVGPGDTPREPNRISAGTFHPDEQGRSHVDLTAAVDPALYPELSITAEPGDGNPAPTGPEVLRATITIDEP